MNETQKQLQIRFMFRSDMAVSKQATWSEWQNIKSTTRDNQFITLYITEEHVQFHSVADVLSFETRIQRLD